MTDTFGASINILLSSGLTKGILEVELMKNHYERIQIDYFWLVCLVILW